MGNSNLELMVKEFNQDTDILVQQTQNFLSAVYPTFLLDAEKNVDEYIEDKSSFLLDSMTFYRIVSCTIENIEDVFKYINEKIEKFFTAIHSINVTIAYGVISYSGTTNLVLGINKKNDVKATKSIVEGLLSGIELKEFTPGFKERESGEKHFGVITAIPTTKIKDQPQTFDLAPLMKSLNGQNYTMLFIAKPVIKNHVVQKLNDLIEVRDKCFAISKRNVSRQSSISNTETDTESNSITKGSNVNVNGAGAGLALGAAAGAFVGSVVAPGVGTLAGAKVGATLGTIIGSSVSYGTNKSVTEGYSHAISQAITNGETIAADIQNGFALELMNYAEKAINRLKEGQNNGMWQTALTYSTDSELGRNIIQACLCGEISKPNPDLLPLRTFTPTLEMDNEIIQELVIPKTLLSNTELDLNNPLCSCLNSSELGLICTIPSDSVPNFELKKGKAYPLVSIGSDSANSVEVGKITDGQRVIHNMPFTLSENDLNKHTFICGITGSGKTTTVKGILKSCKKPFMVIESAKKEYRNIKVQYERRPTVYTLGKPEINCLRMNPFYIMPGVSPQTHMDFLKDLFNASFSFYGPMPYILEKCLYNIYRNKGWNLTLGFHPYLINQNSSVDFFDINYMRSRYALEAHKFLFPTMQELKNEIERYIQEEMQYEGEVAGNIKTAIKARLESLCGGAKGYMFNTNECIDFKNLLENNVVFELEGLADDSDKAFCVGLLVIFINEYRQVQKEVNGNKNMGLQHLLVIEEAHRLLKNVETERSNENMGNPKGKAVEHFTNMIAELRSYGQGVIIAEQIPSKLAPDVIKNSSNKIIQRVVSSDDQQIIANTIGIHSDDAIYLGGLSAGYALCHKEGMALPVNVKVNDIEDHHVSDELLYNKQIDKRIFLINISLVKDATVGTIDRLTHRLLNTIMIEEASSGIQSVEICKEKLNRELQISNTNLVLCNNQNEVISTVLVESFVNFLMNGVYSTKKIISDDFYRDIFNLILSPTPEKVKSIKDQLSRFYERDVKDHGMFIISELIKNKWTNNVDLQKTIDGYFIQSTAHTIKNIKNLISGVV